MLYAVFFSEDGACTGTRFRLLTTPHTNDDFAEEYAVLTKPGGNYHVAFYQNGKSFEFCGAGALCIADYLQGVLDNRADNQIEATVIHHASHSFSVFSASDQPMVALSLVAPDRIEENADYKRRAYFDRQGVQLLQLASVVEVQNYVWSAVNATPPTNTLIALHVDRQTARIHFRYFTAFNDKGEDQATGSIFRYLDALRLPENIWFTVEQCSGNGARMRCIRHGRQCRYTGLVRRIVES